MKKQLLALLSLAPLALLAQELEFTDASALLPSGTVSDHAVGVVDMNGDGLDDIIRMQTSGSQGNASQTIYVAFQEAPGEDFSSETIGTMDVNGTGSADAWGLCVVDVDENGINDLITGGFYNGVYIFKANADATSYSEDIELDEEIYVQGMSAFDINNDGEIDVFICDDNDLSQILTNDGNGNMSEVPSGLVPETDDPSDNSGNYGSVFMDVNNDGHADLYIAKCRQGVTDNTDPRRINHLYMNNGDGTWTSDGEDRGVAIGAQSWSADFGDYDNDGDLDLFVGNHDDLSDFLVNDGTGHFTEMTEEADLESVFPFLVIQTTWADFNNDGLIDLIATGNDSHNIALNNGDGTFESHDDLFGNFPVNSYGLGDLNNDGFIDLYITANGYGGWGNEMWEDRLFLNNGNMNNWFKVALTGVESNINGVGARISIYGPWGVQIREVKAGESYGIQNSMTQHFGLGTYDVIDQVTVTWPSGEEDNFYDISVNQTMNITEGDGAVSVDELAGNAYGISTFPNPVDEVMTLSIEQYEQVRHREVRFGLYDAAGKQVMDQVIGQNQVSLNLGKLASGVYTYNITADEQIIAVSELVKQ